MEYIKNPALPIKVSAVPIPHPIKVGDVDYQPGDYIVVGEKGVEHMTKVDFEAAYSAAKKPRAPRADAGQSRPKKEPPKDAPPAIDTKRRKTA